MYLRSPVDFEPAMMSQDYQAEKRHDFGYLALSGHDWPLQADLAAYYLIDS